MRNVFKKLLVLGAILLSVLSINNLATSSPVYADSDNELGSCRYFLGIRSWDCNIVKNPSSEEELKVNVILIANNILNDLTVAASYIVIGFVIYGGFLYLSSSGDPGKVQSGKKTLIHAFIGLAIVLLSNIVVNTAFYALLGDKATTCLEQGSMARECVTSAAVFVNAIQWAIGIAGVVALIYVVVGGYGYITSSGDPGKLQKAKNTILYACIGLIVVALAEAIVGFVYNTIENAKESNTSYINESIIAKEIKK